MSQGCINTVTVTEWNLEGQGLIIKDSPQGVRKGKSHLSSLWRQSEEKMNIHIVFLYLD